MANISSKKRKNSGQKTEKKPEAETAGVKVALRNNCSHPVFFRKSGRTVRIGPRGTCEVEKSVLSTTELSRLCSNKQVSVIIKSTVAAKTAISEAAEVDRTTNTGTKTNSQVSDAT